MQRDAGFTANFRLRSNLSSRTSVGAQYYKDNFYQNQAQGQRLTFGRGRAILAIGGPARRGPTKPNLLLGERQRAI